MVNIILSILLLAIVNKGQVQTSAVSPSDWSINLGHQYPGITPLFSKIKSGIAVASIIQNDKRQFELLVSAHSRTDGVQRSFCRVSLTQLGERIWDTKMLGLGDSKLVVSWLYNNRTRRQNGLELIVLDTLSCESRNLDLVLYNDVDSVYFLPYSLVAYASGAFDVFVRSENICEAGICRISFDDSSQQIAKAIPFIKDDNPLTWSISSVAEDGPISDFYYFSNPESDIGYNEGMGKIRRLSANGTELASFDLSLGQKELVAQSSAYGNLGFCSSNSSSASIDCLLFDSQLNKKLEVAVPVCSAAKAAADDDCPVYRLPVKRIAMANTADGGFLLLITSCSSDHCVAHVTRARRIAAEGTIGRPIEFLRSKDGCFPRNNYNVFVDEATDAYCAGMPCMRRNSAEDAVYDVSIFAKCVK